MFAHVVASFIYIANLPRATDISTKQFKSEFFFANFFFSSNELSIQLEGKIIP